MLAKTIGVSPNTQVHHFTLVGNWSAPVHHGGDQGPNHAFNQLCRLRGFREVAPMPDDFDYSRGDAALGAVTTVGEISLELELRYKQEHGSCYVNVYQYIDRYRPVDAEIIATAVTAVLAPYLQIDGKSSRTLCYRRY